MPFSYVKLSTVGRFSRSLRWKTVKRPPHQCQQAAWMQTWLEKLSTSYLTASRPDIMFAVCVCARFQSNPKESHFKATKRILKYLKGTTSVGLWYPFHSSINLVGYSDFDFAWCKLDRKSTSDTCHLLGASLISWHSKKQACVALSTAEVGYIVVGSCAHILWIKQQLEDFGLKLYNMPLLCDNTSAINLTKT
ncbi:secreted RxLR effector protein 161-like [Phaseolus vulgaris]|uniref:secreted RxLR effector protein 161-like n=1 Tax=Phaseolus vulgaris TaxID=3885 RepID=UPI0035C9AB82